MEPSVWHGWANVVFVSWKDGGSGGQRGKNEEKERERRESHYEPRETLELGRIILGFSRLLPRPRMAANLDKLVFWMAYAPYSRYLYPEPLDLSDEISRCSRRLFSRESACLKTMHIAMQSPLVEMQTT